ncbi:putative spermidine/putrescine transport system permease protein [Salinihabitans flavidus]|uniref:Putative spermidine/putrescine transport system permease protein n=1 Tax=Salinihabitans flavidus TaxID=569882 RepID=A0A1H8WEL2_9RHOB|nr:ABC transporter permease [Salinihabitans flavidus]SEP26066.1 putative spermidine/putrescine transport system permease protein [Salinihabitans flavidus]
MTSERIGRRGISRAVPYILCAPAIVLVVFMTGALAVLFIESLRVEPGAVELSLVQYREVLSASHQIQLLTNSAWLALLATFISTVLGYPVAHWISEASPRTRVLLLGFLVLTFFSDYVLRMFGLILVFGRNGLANQILMELGIGRLRMMFNTNGVLIGLVASSLPYSILTISGVLGRIDKSQFAAARLLGAPAWRAFVSVTLPLSMPGVIGGAVIVFLLCLNSFVVPALLGGGFVQMAATAIYEQAINLFNLPFGAAMSFILLSAALILLAITNFVLDRFGRRFGIAPARRR